MAQTRKPRTRSNGEGSIYARPDGRWCAALSVGWTATGNPRRKLWYGDTREEVRKKLTAAIRERDQGGGAAPAVHRPVSGGAFS